MNHRLLLLYLLLILSHLNVLAYEPARALDIRNDSTQTKGNKIVLQENKYLKQQMMAQRNTTYVIKYNFILVDDIKIPDGCTLEFDGGSIEGKHIITGDNTAIRAESVIIFSPDISVVGTWNVSNVYPEWFGAKGDGVVDDAIAINKCLSFNSMDVNNPIKILFTKPKYFVGATINFSGKSHISFEGINKNTIKKMKDNHNNMFDGGKCKHIRISKLTLDGSLEDWTLVIPTKPNWDQGRFNACIIGASNTTDITVDDCVIKNFYYGVFLGGAYEQNRLVDGQKDADHVTITNCIFERNKMSCIDTYNRYGLFISNNYFIDNGNIAVHIEPTIIDNLSGPYNTSDIFEAHYPVDGVNICNNTFVWTETPAIGIKLYKGVYAATIINNHFINGSAAIHSDGTKMFTISNNTVKNGIGIRLYGELGTGSINGNILINVTSGISCYNDATTMGGVDIHDNFIILKDDLSSRPDYFKVQNSKYHDNVIRGYFNHDEWKIKGVLDIGGSSNSEIYNNKLLKCNDTTIPFFVVPITNQIELSSYIKNGVRIYNNIYEQKLEYEISTDITQVRPKNPFIGQQIFDLNINKLIIFKGDFWVDAFGNVVE